MIIGVLPVTGLCSLSDGPWRYFQEGLESKGAQVEDLRVPGSQVDAVVTFNVHRGYTGRDRAVTVPRSRRFLIMMEPEATLPALYRRSYLDSFEHVFAASKDWADRVGGTAFLWPQEVSSVRTSTIPTADVSMLCANKRSAMSTGLYGLRRQVIHGLQTASLNLALFGEGWDASRVENVERGTRATMRAIAAGRSPDLHEAFGETSYRPPAWRGYAVDKTAAISIAPVSVVIENSVDYVSEKLIDVIRVGRVPIYVGPQLSEYSIEPDVAICAAPDADAIISAIRLSLGEGANSVLAAGREWLKSSQAAAHSHATVLGELGRDIADTMRRNASG